MQSHSAPKRIKAEEPLSLAEVLHHCVASAVVAAASRRRITTFNHAAEVLTGAEARRALRQPIDVLLPPLCSAMQETFASGQAITDREISLARDDGTQIRLQANTTADRDPEG